VAGVAAVLDNPERFTRRWCACSSAATSTATAAERDPARPGRRRALPQHPGTVVDRPARWRAVGLIAELGANVLDVAHSRVSGALALGEVEVQLRLETRGPRHQTEVLEAFRLPATRCRPVDRLAGVRLGRSRVTFIVPPLGSWYCRVSPTLAPGSPLQWGVRRVDSSPPWLLPHGTEQEGLGVLVVVVANREAPCRAGRCRTRWAPRRPSRCAGAPAAAGSGFPAVLVLARRVVAAVLLEVAFLTTRIDLRGNDRSVRDQGSSHA